MCAYYFLITKRNASVLCLSECTCLHKTWWFSLLKVMKTPTQEGDHSCKLYNVVPKMKREYPSDEMKNCRSIYEEESNYQCSIHSRYVLI